MKKAEQKSQGKDYNRHITILCPLASSIRAASIHFLNALLLNTFHGFTETLC